MDRDEWPIVVKGVAVLIVFIALLLEVGGQIAFYEADASIKQLKLDIVNVDPKQAEDVIGQATQWNQKIAVNKLYNKIFFVSWFIPDGWDSITPIQIPKVNHD